MPYKHEAIWRRIFTKVDLTNFRRARTEKQRLKFFKNAIKKSKEKPITNLSNLPVSDFTKIYALAVAGEERRLKDAVREIKRKPFLTARDRQNLLQNENFERIRKELGVKKVRIIGVAKRSITKHRQLNKWNNRFIKAGIDAFFIPEKKGIRGRQPIHKKFNIKIIEKKRARAVSRTGIELSAIETKNNRIYIYKKGHRGIFKNLPK